MMIRRAVEDDIPGMVDLMDARRRLYETYQSTFWRPSPDANSLQMKYFETLVSKKDEIVLVCEDAGAFRGFIVASLIEAPPVYDPGGKTCVIDDFAVTGNDWDGTGRALIREALRLARAAGAVQGVVVCGHLDEAKRAFLRSEGLSIASEWFVKSL
jgi:ribosomal protein S18 acetylase RimI-like enzyme